MIALCCLLAVLIASGPTHGQLTCATLPDPPGSPCIEHNETTQDIYAPLYPSDSTVIVVFGPGDDTRIDVRFDVEIYMDCSGLLTQMEGGAPSTEMIYFLQTVEQDAVVVMAGTGGRDTRDIIGDNMEILRIRNVSYATGAVGGSQGRYHCFVCPMGTPVTVADIEDCDTNATVLVTVLEDLPQVCTGSNEDMLAFDRGEVPVKPGRDYVCLTEDPNPGPNDFAFIEDMLDPDGEFNNLRFICQLAPGLNVPGHVATASFNGEDIFAGDTVFPNTVLCPTDDVFSQDCGVYELNDDLSIGLNIGITNADLELYYGVYTCTITVADLDVTDSASFIASNCAPPTIASEPPQTIPSTGTVTIGNFACTGSTLSCPIEVSTGTPVNITWRINGVEEEFISTASAQTVTIMADTPGTYTCNATNHFGTAEVSSDVVAPPTLDGSAVVLPAGTSNGCSRITDGSAFDVCPAVNEMVEFDCDYDTAVPSNVQSLAGDVLLYDNGGTQISMTVTFTLSGQAGTYSCRTQTAVCGAISRQDLVVSVHAAPQIISGYTGLSAADLGVNQVLVVGQDILIAEGDSIALLCPSTGITQPTAQWTFDGSDLDATDPRISQRTDQTDSSIEVSILTISNVMSSDDGIYGCTASNNVINAAVSASVTLEVLAAPRPDLTITITDSVGGDVSATSCARIDPMPAGVQACPLVGERVVISCVSNPAGLDVTLHIPPSDAAHSQNSITASSIQEGGNIPNGQYSCRSNGEADTGTLQLYEPPQIFVNYMPTALLTMQLMATQVFVVGSSGTMNFVMGDSLAIVCPYTGIPTPTVQWTHNGTAVDPTDPRITILQQTDQDDTSIQLSILNITALMSSDIGSYRCTVSNVVVGDAAESISLGEVEAPKPVLTITITDSFGRDWSTTSCSRIDPRPPGIDVCPLVGETVVISCVSSPPGSEVSLRIPPSNAEHTEDQIVASSIQEGGNIPDGVYSCQLNGEADSDTLRLYEPPNIDRNAPPPDPPAVPGGGEVEDVARLQGEAVPIQEGANAILFFPFTGMAATATFFRLEGDTRVEITAATPGYMIIQDPASQGVFLVVTNFTSGDAGTYEFVASNDAGTVSTTATLIVERENVWVASPWSTCEPDCHKGERVRQVVCREMPGNVLQPDNECDPPKPPTTELCVNRGPCYLVPQWAHGDWSECSQPCGGGYRERDIFCIVPRTGALVDHSNCYAHSTPPSSFEYCNLHPCCTTDLYTEWCKLIRGTSFCALSPYYDVYCCWSCSGGAV